MTSTNPEQSAILLIHCPDRKGIVVSVTEFIFKNKGNILYLDQHVDTEKGVFFMRVAWDLSDFMIPMAKIGEYFDTLVAKRFDMRWKLYLSDDKPRMAVFVSKLPHCLYDILSRVQSGEWQVKIALIISNHEDLQPVAKQFGIPYQVLPIDKTNKAAQEDRQIELMQKNRVDFIVLARYMQILTENFVAKFPNRIINIHHSFLPAFRGAKPYHSAYERGVKVIGATSHYVTPDLDAGPIIEQDVTRVSHVDTVDDLVRKGRDLEKLVLARAIWYQIQHKILAYDNRTVIFS